MTHQSTPEILGYLLRAILYRKIGLNILVCLLGFLPLATAQTVIGGQIPDNSAMLDIQGTSRGVLFPRLDATQRNAISNPATGLMVFNTTSACLEINLGTPANAVWSSLRCTTWDTLATINCLNPTVTGTLFNGESANGVRVTLPYTGGGGGSIALQTVTSTVVSGLTATLAAGSIASGAGSLNIDISGTPSGIGNATFSMTIGGQACSFSIPVLPLCRAKVTPTEYAKFMCYNLGAANTNADPFSPSWEIIGGYWQWGTLAQGAPGPSGSGSTEGNDGVITGWNTMTIPPQGAWLDGYKTQNDPCPPGYQVPPHVIWLGVKANNTLSYVGSFNIGATNYTSGLSLGSELFLPAGGFRSSGDGSLVLRNAFGYYWSSTEWTLVQAWVFQFLSNVNAIYTDSRLFGMSVRCVEDR